MIRLQIEQQTTTGSHWFPLVPGTTRCDWFPAPLSVGAGNQSRPLGDHSVVPAIGEPLDSGAEVVR